MTPMRRMIPSLLLLLALAASPAIAAETITVVADSTMDGHAGIIAHSVSTFGEGNSVFLFEEAGKLRFYAARDFGVQDWNVMPNAQYIAPTAPMNVGDTWNFLDDDSGLATLARVTGQEDVTTAAGTFSTFRVDVELVSDPGVTVETLWFAWEVGFVRDQGYLGGVVDWRDELENYTVVGGTGYMPAVVGNSWTFAEVTVPAENASWGGMKSLFR